jgi:hypothetical protein
MEDFKALSDEQQNKIIQPFDNCITTVERQKLIAVIRDTVRCFEDFDYQQQLARVGEWSKPAPVSTPASPSVIASTQPAIENAPSKTGEPRIEYVPVRSLKVAFNKAWLTDEEDVERYLVTLGQALLQEVRNGKRIQI